MRMYNFQKKDEKVRCTVDQIIEFFLLIFQQWNSTTEFGPYTYGMRQNRQNTEPNHMVERQTEM
jgi:hypothetical protein